MDHMHAGHNAHAGHMGPTMNPSKADMPGVPGMTTEMVMDHGMGMSMSFHFGYDEVILFDWWKISTVGGLIGSMIGIFVLAMLYEGLKYLREHLYRSSIMKLQYSANVDKSQMTESTNKTVQMNMLSLDHSIQTLLHMLQMFISYLLMLIFMTYNVWLCLALILGAGLGYFLFGWKKSVVVDITEHCH